MSPKSPLSAFSSSKALRESKVAAAIAAQPGMDYGSGLSRRHDRSIRLCGRMLVGTLVASTASPMVKADDTRATPDPYANTLTGDWGGVRTKLLKRGITLRADYVSESFDVTHGGLKQGARYSQQIRFGADFDMGKLFGWTGGTFHLTMNDRAGRGASSDLIGNRMAVQEVYSSQFAKLTEFSYDQYLFNKRVNVKFGLSAMGNDFGGMPILCDLVNAAFCAHPLAMSGGSGWGNYPNSRWGVRVAYNFTPALVLRMATFQVNPYYSTEAHGFSFTPHGNTGLITPVELEWQTGGGTGPGHHPGDYKLGAYYDNSKVAREGRTGDASGRDGEYFLAQQSVYREREDSTRGLTLVGQAMMADRITAQITRWYSISAIYQGTFPGRDQDVLALGYVRAVINPRLQQAYRVSNPEIVDAEGFDGLTNAEATLELSYGWQATPWLLVRPDAQYVIDPGTYKYKHIPNAVALGLQLKIQF